MSKKELELEEQCVNSEKMQHFGMPPRMLAKSIRHQGVSSPGIDVYVRVPDTGSMYPMDDTDS
jgi:hypothetical protein